MAESGVTATVGAARTRGQWLSMVARQRELSLVAIMVVLGGLVSISAPQFLTPSNLSQVASLASIIAVAAVGQAIVVITRNIDLSVEATMGLVAYCVAIVLERHALDAPAAIAFGLGPGGTVVVAGIPAGDHSTIAASIARRKGLDLRFSRRMNRAYPRAIALVEAGVVDVSSLVTHRFPLADFKAAFRTAVRRDGLKVIVNPSAKARTGGTP